MREDVVRDHEGLVEPMSNMERVLRDVLLTRKVVFTWMLSC